MDFPSDLKYSKTHEWIRVEGKEAVIGISGFAAEELGDIVYVELPEEGEDIEKDTAFGVVESVKATEDLFAPLSGQVIEINTPLQDAPEVVNEDCYGDGWLIRIALKDPSELNELLSAQAYTEFVEEQQES